MNHEVNQTTYILNDLQVFNGFAKDLGDNGLSADACMVCKIAPEVDGDSEWVYVSTNGGFIVVGYIDDKGDLELSNEIKDCIEADDMAWLREILANEFNVEFDV